MATLFCRVDFAQGLTVNAEDLHNKYLSIKTTPEDLNKEGNTDLRCKYAEKTREEGKV